jgi:hypothetical protein
MPLKIHAFFGCHQEPLPCPYIHQAERRSPSHWDFGRHRQDLLGRAWIHVSTCTESPSVVRARPHAGAPTPKKCTSSWRWSQRQVMSKQVSLLLLLSADLLFSPLSGGAGSADDSGCPWREVHKTPGNELGKQSSEALPNSPSQKRILRLCIRGRGKYQPRTQFWRI